MPSGLSLDKIEQALLAVPGVLEIHDLHVWALTSGKNSLTVHLVVRDGSEEQAVLQAATGLLASQFALRHATVQIEAGACEIKDTHGEAHFSADSHNH